jgi:hypothetical protein
MAGRILRTMIIPPPLSASDFAKPGLRPADASARSARSDPVPAPPVPRAKPRSTPSSWMANVSTGAVADEQDVPKARIVPRMAPPAWSKSKGAEQSPATAKGKPARPRNEAQQPRSTRPIGRKSNASAAARTENPRTGQRCQRGQTGRRAARRPGHAGISVALRANSVGARPVRQKPRRDLSGCILMR